MQFTRKGIRTVAKSEWCKGDFFKKKKNNEAETCFK